MKVKKHSVELGVSTMRSFEVQVRSNGHYAMGIDLSVTSLCGRDTGVIDDITTI